MKDCVEVKDKYMLTIDEASQYFNIGTNKLRKFVDEHRGDSFVFYNGKRLLIKRKIFEDLINKVDTI